MTNNKILIPAFCIVTLVQLLVPAKMIWDRENILNTGAEFKFETAPVDPTDPFRGKYVVLRYTENTVDVEESENWKRGDNAYAYLSKGIQNYTKVDSISRKKPEGTIPYLKTEIQYAGKMGRGISSVRLNFPFDRYYMEESKAKPAEDIYVQTQKDTTSITYALVNIKNGNAVLKDVIINGKPIKEIVKELQSTK